MEKYSLNYDSLHQSVNKKSYLLSEVKDKITKVAFDVVRFVDADGLDQLWKVQSENGEDYIVAMYDEQVKTASAPKTPWSTTVTKSGHVQVFLKGNPIVKLAMRDLYLEAADAPFVAESLPQKLATDTGFYKNFLNSLSEPERNLVLSQDIGS